ncbi:hypothetical protein ALNOE001_01030 [Candidatus Methanobinarius endosymbioticus]|uniref:Uncharacterized protein n=1 Tax=Candidatus Methanobinarius endosymbioticus TaxID=2006182 RepID=A0A366MDW7_9EURY|nr:hypothetical protein ALNOE001_01030 [Candidatus Methanobinarius endosymbioticus]
MSKIINITILNCIVTNLSTVSNNVAAGQNAQFKYVIGSNNETKVNNMNLPYFTLMLRVNLMMLV